MKKVIAAVLAVALVAGVAGLFAKPEQKVAADIIMYSDPKPGG